MKRMRLSIIYLLAIVFSAGVYAQGPSIDLNNPIPVDPNVRIGKLDNGLTYYIRKNVLPEKSAQFWLVVDAGAIQEEPHQNGLAHFCEHMAFNGTENFEKHDIIHYLQSIGMKFGPEINAFTSHDVTNYMLQKVPIDVKENIDTSLMILYDWASNVTYSEEEIDNERGVIHEEWRSRRSADFRMRTKYQKVLYQGSKYADHDVIGDIDIIDNCPYEALTSFYKEWYRPDLEAIIAVGDFDVDFIENKIKTMFSKIPKRENAKERMAYDIPDHKEILVAIETDKEAQYTMVQAYFKHDVTKNKQTVNYLRNSIKNELYSIMLNARLQELLLDENPPFIYGFAGYNENLARSKDAYISFAVSKNNEALITLKTMFIENERVKKYGFTVTEFDRSKNELLKDLEKAYNERNKQKSSKYCWEYFGNFLTDDPIPGAEFEFETAKKLTPEITLEEVNALAIKWIREENLVIIITAPEKEDITVPTVEEVLSTIESVKSENIEAYVDKVSDKPLLSTIPGPGKIENKKKDKELGIVEWTFENGVKVVLKPTDFKDDEIVFSAYSLGGSSVYDLKDDVSASFAADVVSSSGISEFDQVELDKKLSSKVVRINPYINELEEGLRGSSSQEDFETLLQMIYLYFTNPRVDKTAYSSLMTRYKGFIENRSANPASAFRDTIQVTMAQYNPRRRPLTTELLEEANFKRINYIFKNRFGDPGSFIFYFVGNIDIKTAKPLLEKYLGGLPKVSRNENWTDLNIQRPKGVIKKTLNKEMEVPKSTVFVAFTGPYDYNRKDNIYFDAFKDILDVRYTETIREEESGTYGVGVRIKQTHFPKQEFQLRIQFECGPENVEKLKAIVFEEIEKIKKDGPTAKDLNGVKENKLKKRKENLKENKFWLSGLKYNDFHGMNALDNDEYESLVNNMTAEDIKIIASKYLKGDNYVEVILMPEK
ncbi:MAG: insulinase family protein [Bacteroidales bacterium]|nr:insulinase family protein [Bacteroidales bacterium]